MTQGDIFLVNLDPTFGHEQQGTRPVMIVSSQSFQKSIRMPVIAPVTTGGSFARIAGFTVSLTGCGTRTGGVIRCDQIRSLDQLARNAKFVERVPSFIVEEVLQKIATIFGWE